LKLSLSYCIL